MTRQWDAPMKSLKYAASVDFPEQLPPAIAKIRGDDVRGNKGDMQD